MEGYSFIEHLFSLCIKKVRVFIIFYECDVSDHVYK